MYFYEILTSSRTNALIALTYKSRGTMVKNSKKYTTYLYLIPELANWQYDAIFTAKYKNTIMFRCVMHINYTIPITPS